MKLNINDISLSDIPITLVTFNQKLSLITIISNNCYRISDKNWFGKTEIIIEGWKEFFIEKYVSESQGKGETFQIDFTKNLETFELIQEIEWNTNENVFLKGWSKESGAWLTYYFKNGKFDIEAAVRN